MRLVKVFLVLVFSSIALFGCSSRNNEPQQNKNVSTEPARKEIPAQQINTNSKTAAPEFKLKSVDGKDVRLSDFKGKVVVLDFWATWCGPCRMGIPDLVALQNEYKGNLVVLGISLDKFSGTDNQVKSFMKELKINYPIVFGDEQVTKDYGNIEAIPTSFIIDAQGNIVDKHIGLVPKEAFTDQIKSLIKES